MIATPAAAAGWRRPRHGTPEGIAQIVEAMSSHRPQRAARGVEQALEHVAAGAGRLYEPAAAACLRVWREGCFAFSLPSGTAVGPPSPPV